MYITSQYSEYFDGRPLRPVWNTSLSGPNFGVEVVIINELGHV